MELLPVVSVFVVEAQSSVQDELRQEIVLDLHESRIGIFTPFRQPGVAVGVGQIHPVELV